MIATSGAIDSSDIVRTWALRVCDPSKVRDIALGDGEFWTVAWNILQNDGRTSTIERSRNCPCSCKNKKEISSSHWKTEVTFCSKIQVENGHFSRTRAGTRVTFPVLILQYIGLFHMLLVTGQVMEKFRQSVFNKKKNMRIRNCCINQYGHLR